MAIFNMAAGGGEPTLQTKNASYTPSETAQAGTITADSGYDGLSSVSVSVGAVSNTYVGSGITRRSSTDLTASGATVTVPSGYYSAQVSKAVASGTAGTPTATKGTVSNHSVLVTPSVTNTTGYITGDTKTGTAVSVSASELVSGSETKTENGTYDVTNLASLVVNVSGGGASNFITGTFQYSTTTAAAQTITLNYSGSGYPIAVAIVLDDGVLDSTYTNTVARYSIAQYFMTKTYADTAPTFATSGEANQGAVATVYKSSASNAATLTRTSSATVNTFSSSNAAGSTTTCVRFKSKTKMSIYSGANSGTSRYGFFSGKKYRYWIIYSA